MPAEDAVDALYGLSLGEFVAARNALVKDLRAAGEKDEAARVAALRKPAAGAWVVNQLARSAPDDVAALLAAGQKLAGAQAGALRGAGSAPLREAAGVQRAALRRLLERARPLVRTDQQLNRVGEILRTAAADPDVGDLVAAGRLAEEPEVAGFGRLASVAPDAEDDDEAEEVARQAAERERDRERAELERRAERAEREADRLEHRAQAAEREARERREAADLARQEADRLRPDQSNSLP